MAIELPEVVRAQKELEALPANAPFLKGEASKYNEVGYVGRDVESMIRDLMDVSIEMIREEKLEEVSERAEMNAEERLLDLLLPLPPPPVGTAEEAAAAQEHFQRTRERRRARLRGGELDDKLVEGEVRERSFPAFEIVSSSGVEERDINIKEMLPGLFGQQEKKRGMKGSEAQDYLVQEEERRVVAMEQV